MSRPTSIFICQSCGAQSRQFFGRCSNCGDWNSIIEQLAAPTELRGKRSNPSFGQVQAPAQRSEPIATDEEKLLVKSEEEYTSPISKIYKVETEYIIITENSIYVVSADIPTKRVS